VSVVDALPLILVSLGHFAWPSSIMVRRDALELAGGFDERLMVAEHAELWLRLALRGPFCLVRKHTVVHQTTRGSLMERGIREHQYIRSFEVMGETVIEPLAQSGNGIGAAARGCLQWIRALRALADEDEHEVRDALEQACALLPELSAGPALVARRIRMLGAGAEERLRCFGLAARCWPEPRSATGLFLRSKALRLALDVHDWPTARLLLAGWPLTATPGFACRNVPLWHQLTRDALEARRFRGEDTPAPARAALPVEAVGER